MGAGGTGRRHVLLVDMWCGEKTENVLVQVSRELDLGKPLEIHGQGVESENKREGKGRGIVLQ